MRTLGQQLTVQTLNALSKTHTPVLLDSDGFEQIVLPLLETALQQGLTKLTLSRCINSEILTLEYQLFCMKTHHEQVFSTLTHTHLNEIFRVLRTLDPNVLRNHGIKISSKQTLDSKREFLRFHGKDKMYGYPEWEHIVLNWEKGFKNTAVEEPSAPSLDTLNLLKEAAMVSPNTQIN